MFFSDRKFITPMITNRESLGDAPTGVAGFGSRSPVYCFSAFSIAASTSGESGVVWGSKR
jgi:hypothetical protein